MNSYLVGGAVRDELLHSLLGLRPRGGDRDFVVTGATPQLMLDAGYRQVGRNFPVFLHPDTHEQYALARDSSGGVARDIPLEADLARRDLTINAMAYGEGGNLVDPFGGRDDIRRGMLRQVEGAFAADPLRIIRLARFAAELPHFMVETGSLHAAQAVVSAGALDAVDPERIFAEMRKAFQSTLPSRFVQVLRTTGALAALLPEVDHLFGVPQPGKYHPEFDAGIHTCMAMDVAAGLMAGSAEVVFAALVHDLGKGITPPRDWPSHRGHERRGLPLVEAVCDRLKVPVAWQRLAMSVCEYHLHLHRVAELKPATVVDMFSAIGLYHHPDRLEMFCAACEADSRGRTGLEKTSYPQTAFLRDCLEAVGSIDVEPLRLRYSGRQLGDAVRKARIRQLSQARGRRLARHFS